MPTAHSGLDHFFRMIAPYQPWKYGIIPILVGSEARVIAFFQGRVLPEKQMKYLPKERETPLTFIDLFCGIGSFHNSFSKKG